MIGLIWNLLVFVIVLMDDWVVSVVWVDIYEYVIDVLID